MENDITDISMYMVYVIIVKRNYFSHAVGSNPLTLSGSSLEVGTNTIYLRLTGNGSTVVNKLITATVSQGT